MSRQRWLPFLAGAIAVLMVVPKLRSPGLVDGFDLEGFGQLPVVDRGKLVGCITRHHMLHGIMAMAEAEDAEIIRIEADAKEAVNRPRAIAEMQKVFASYSKSQLVSRLGRKAK